MDSNHDDSDRKMDGDPPPPPDAYATRASLFGQLRQGDKKMREYAWREFRRRYAPIIAAFACKCDVHGQEVDDVVQEVIMAFLANEDFAYDPAKGRFRGWLMTCTLRIANRRKRNSFKHGGVPLDQVPDLEAKITPLWNDLWENQLMIEALQRLSKLHAGSKQLRAFNEYGLKGRDADTVAGELSISVDSVYKAKSRLTGQLRTLVQEIRDADD